MHVRGQLIGTWIGLASVLIFGAGFWPTSGFLPPSDPSMTAEQVSEYFQTHTGGIRLGMILMNIGGALLCVQIAVVHGQLKRIKNVNPMLTNAFLVTGAVCSVVIIVGAMLMTAVAFRPGRPTEITYALFDVAWLMVIMPGATYVLLMVLHGAAILGDFSDDPLFPRWLGYFNIWAGLMILPGLSLTYFKQGPLAWNGLINFWIAGTAFLLWFFVNFSPLRRAIRRPDDVQTGGLDLGIPTGPRSRTAAPS